MQILLDNFIEAWINAIKYHDKIMKGYITLGIQKQFVSSLHNAVELCLKQKMLDKNDTSVAEIKIKEKEDAKLSVKYFEFAETGSLNDFFKRLTSDEISKFRSIEFNQLKTKYKKLININETEKELFTKSLDLLQELRNNEAHFYIDKRFISDETFCKLHNFMIIFYRSAVKIILAENKLLYNSDYIEDRFFYKYKDFFNDSEYKDNYDNKFAFERSELKIIFTKSQLLSNEITQKIKEVYNTYFKTSNPYDFFYPDNLPKYAHSLTYYITGSKHEDIYALLVSLKATKLIELKECMGTMADEEGNEEECSFGYAIKFNY